MEVNGRDPVIVDKVVELLGAGYSIKNVANELKINSGLIVSISKREPVKRRIRELKKDEKKKLKKNVATTVVEEEEKNMNDSDAKTNNNTTTVKVRTKNDLSDDEKIAIIDLYNGGKTADEIAAIYNCSRWTVYGLAKEFSIMKRGTKSSNSLNKKKNLKLKKQEDDILKQEEKEQMAEVNGDPEVIQTPVKATKPATKKKKIVIVIPDKNRREEIFTEQPSDASKQETSVNTLNSEINRFLVSDGLYKCGLCSNRHENMPVNTFVFDREIRSYDLQRKEDRINEACNFIDTVIPFKDGLPTKKLYLYATGNQILFQAVIMACMRKKVNLIVCHYYSINGSTDQFDYDNMDMEFGFPDLALSSTPEFINGLNNKFNSIYVSGSTSIEELNNLDTFYMLKEVHYSEPSSLSNPENNDDVTVTCYSNITDCMLDYSKFVEEFSKVDRRVNNDYKGVFIHPVMRRANGQRILSSALTKSFNFLSK